MRNIELSLKNILSHKPPFLLIDTIKYYEQGRIVCKKRVKKTEFYFDGHFPTFPIVPGVIILEMMIQASGALLRLDNFVDLVTPTPGRVVRIESASFYKEVLPDTTLEIESNYVQRITQYAKFESRVLKSNLKIADAELIILFRG